MLYPVRYCLSPLKKSLQKVSNIRVKGGATS